MIKGVNKKVLEINNPQSLYFEKAVLYLKPNMNNIPEKLVRREAQSIICSIGPKPPKYTFIFRKLIPGMLLFSAGGAGMFILFSIIH